MALRRLCIDAIDGMASRRLRALVSLSRAMALHAKLHLYAVDAMDMVATARQWDITPLGIAAYESDAGRAT